MYAFFKKHFLHWLEAMGILGLILEATGEFNIVQEIIQVIPPFRYYHY